MIRHSNNTSESWNKLPWKKFRKNLFRLQIRLYKAIKAGDKRKARSIQKLILRSKAARFLAIRQVTQLNSGKKTAGIDGKASLKNEERFALEIKLKKDYLNWHHSKLYNGETSKALKKQHHACGYCGLKMLSEERVHLHHIDGNHNNCKTKNLLAVHESCHDYHHMSKGKPQNVGSWVR